MAYRANEVFCDVYYVRSRLGPRTLLLLSATNCDTRALLTSTVLAMGSTFSRHGTAPLSPPYSNSWMIPSGLLGSGPVRVVIDMLSASEGVVAVSHLLGGLLARPGEEGPTFAADLFAALVAADAEASAGPESGSSGGGALHAQVRTASGRPVDATVE